MDREPMAHGRSGPVDNCYHVPSPEHAMHDSPLLVSGTHWFKRMLSNEAQIVCSKNHSRSSSHVQADLSKLSNSAEAKTGPNGQVYWTVVFSIEIHFGLTEFKARIKWTEDVGPIIFFV